jgi:hypothetical protein
VTFTPDPAAVAADRLYDQLPAALAVEHALTPDERAAFAAQALVGQYDGAAIADWIEDAADRDGYLGQIEAWSVASGDAAIADLVARYGLPERVAAGLAVRAVYATIVLEHADLDVARGPHPIARDAALWLLGYAYARGIEVQP